MDSQSRTSKTPERLLPKVKDQEVNMNKIILQADCKFEDTELRNIVKQLETKIQTLNERTKRQTIQIRELEKKVTTIK